MCVKFIFTGEWWISKDESCCEGKYTKVPTYCVYAHFPFSPNFCLNFAFANEKFHCLLLFQLLMLLFNVVTFGSGISTCPKEQFKELLKDLLEVDKIVDFLNNVN